MGVVRGDGVLLAGEKVEEGRRAVVVGLGLARLAPATAAGCSCTANCGKIVGCGGRDRGASRLAGG